jgi:peptidoglycan/xylan/chitin deacetylase (PgdA/CDA1 family)
MSELNRRRILTALAASTLAGVGLARCTVGVPAQTLADSARSASLPQAAGPSGVLPPPPASARVPLPAGGSLFTLPGQSDLLALTVDDGVRTDVVQAYTQFAKDTGVRLTFFVTGAYKSWTENRDALRPLVESGQIQLGNHTWTHPWMTQISKDQIVDELRRCHQFLTTNFGVDARPFYRPPYGKHDAVVDGITAELGYNVPTMWSGSLSDENVITPDYLVTKANKYFTPQTIVIGHLNHPAVTHTYPQLVDLIRSRNLRTVTLNDVFHNPDYFLNS